MWILRTVTLEARRTERRRAEFEKRGDKMRRGMMRPPGFPLIPFLFPMGVFLGLLGLTAWFSYLSYRELDAIRRAEESRPTGP